MRSHGFGRGAKLIAEGARERFVGAVAVRERDGEDVRRAVGERTCGFRQAPGARVLHHGLTEQQHEQARQMEPRHASDAGNLVHREIALEMGFDIPDRLLDGVHWLLT